MKDAPITVQHGSTTIVVEADAAPALARCLIEALPSFQQFVGKQGGRINDLDDKEFARWYSLWVRSNGVAVPWA